PGPRARRWRASRAPGGSSGRGRGGRSRLLPRAHRSMARFALLVTLRVRSDAVDAFRARILAAAEAAVREEEHCLRFEVAQDEEDPATFVLFEVYTDAAALAHHHTTP